MKVPSNWIAALSVALSFPSIIITIGWLSVKLVDLGLVEHKTAVLIFILWTSSFLGLIVWYGIKKKN